MARLQKYLTARTIVPIDLSLSKKQKKADQIDKIYSKISSYFSLNQNHLHK